MLREIPAVAAMTATGTSATSQPAASAACNAAAINSGAMLSLSAGFGVVGLFSGVM